MNVDFMKPDIPDGYTVSQNIYKFNEDSSSSSNGCLENDFFSRETYTDHSSDMYVTDNSLVARQPYTAEFIENTENGQVSTVNLKAGIDQMDKFEDSNTNSFKASNGMNSSILNVPLVKTSFVYHNKSLQSSDYSDPNLNRISNEKKNLGTIHFQFQMPKESVSLMSEKASQREITDTYSTLQKSKQSTGLPENSTVKKSVSKRKSTIPRRRERLKESNNDEKLVEKEVKKYLLKIPSFAPVMQGLTADTRLSEGQTYEDSITSQNKCLKDPECLPTTKSNPTADIKALGQTKNEKELNLSQNLDSREEISSQECSEIKQQEKSNNENGELLDEPFEKSENYLENDSAIKTMEAVTNANGKPKSSKPKPKVVCELCNKSFGRPSELKRHTLLHTGEKPHSCDECKKVFSQRYHLIRHVKNVHKKEIENLVCGVCSETFNSEYLLMRHVKRHGIMTFACEICSKEYKTKRQMKEHVLSLHVGVKPFKCDQCDKVFSRKYHLERHVMIHSGIKDYQCEYCGKEFCTKGNLLAHVRRVHLKVREFSCGVCNKGFYSPKDLQTHLKKHTGEKPYQCEICLKRFSERVNMEWHLRIHSGERPYQCENCEKSYTRMPHLIRHQREGLCARRSRIGAWNSRTEQDESLATEESQNETEFNFSHENSFHEELNSSEISFSENSVLEMNDSESSGTIEEMDYCENDTDL